MTNPELVDWSRAQFALTVIYHYLFVPLTLGLSFIIAIFESLYYKTGYKKWKETSSFWMTIFGINFAIGVATGLIMEFEFGTNWANYSWIVGDIFGAPLAIEGLMAFFLEATFFAVMFFGREKVSRKFYLLSVWLVAVGSNLSALWILIANGWMQFPVGTSFDLDMSRFIMTSFWDVALSPVAISKFTHSVSSAFVTSSLVVMGISSFYILRNKFIPFAKRSIIVASIFGFVSSLGVIITGDNSAHNVAKAQPMKLAAMEGLYKGEREAGLVIFGLLNHNKKLRDSSPSFFLEVKIPYALSFLSFRKFDSFVPGIEDLIWGNKEENIISEFQKIEYGKKAIKELELYHQAKKEKNKELMIKHEQNFREVEKYLGHGHLNSAEEIVPNVPVIVYSFHLMVALGSFFILLFALFIFLSLKNKLTNYKPILLIAVASTPLGYLASQLGWVVAEVGRQPWVIQNILLTKMGATDLASSSVKITFWAFAILFTFLLIVELRIIKKQISKGPEDV